MNLIHRLEYWGDKHHPQWLDIIRVLLGVFLFFKGIQFLNNMGVMINLMSHKMSFGSFILVIIGHYIVSAHILGGLLIVLGVLTRFACLIQIPILIGAIVFINSGQEFLQPFSELLLAIVTLILLFYFLIVGNGPWSFSRVVESANKK
jgi:putative oxidoreductase